MKQYLEMLHAIIEGGKDSDDRTGTGTRKIFGYQNRYHMSDGFPLLTTKQVYWKGVVYELLWFLKGSTNIKYLHEHNVHIWDEWADENGELGPVYGKQWRSWPDGKGGTIDQIANVIREIRRNPDSRRLIVTAWNPAEVDEMALPPCHTIFQFDVLEKKYLSLQLYQRSADVFLGVPFNIASYALLLHMVAHSTGLIPYEFIHTFGDLHIYKNHFEQVGIQLARDPRKLPKLNIKCMAKDIDQYDFEDFELIGYDPWPKIKAEVSV